ncbi:hypothetical protein NLX74_05310 [Paenibacillus sp. MZ03-122A]|nr:hypothetical protein [Paenibacillus sp. MZ03-122A]
MVGVRPLRVRIVLPIAVIPVFSYWNKDHRLKSGDKGERSASSEQFRPLRCYPL